MKSQRHTKNLQGINCRVMPLKIRQLRSYLGMFQMINILRLIDQFLSTMSTRR